MENSLDELNNRLDTEEKMISDLKDVVTETIQDKDLKKKDWNNMKKAWTTCEQPL